MDVFGAATQLVDFIWKACSYYLLTSPDAAKELNDIEVALGIDIFPNPPQTDEQTPPEFSQARPRVSRVPGRK